MLLEYFVQRFSRKLGKTFSKIDKRTVELFRSYDWPGSVRELQNVVERSVILSSNDVFCVEEAWLSASTAKKRWGNPRLSLRTATQVASGRSLKPYSRKVEAGSTVRTELRPSFVFHRRPLIPRSRNCRFARATSNSARPIHP
jgi:transcriptional regulator with PAS, ATPase and Fis domain